MDSFSNKLILVLESGLFEGRLSDAFHQVLLIVGAFLGAQVGQYLISTIKMITTLQDLGLGA
ncbi:MAG: hypothetical protein KGZ96_08480 [Clostridia bacterium]|nr:hypothetical protein [Clostridia bacterium]